MKQIAILVLLFVGAASAQSRPKAPSQAKPEGEPLSAPSDRAATGRFHLVAVKAPGRSISGSIEAYDELFLYDSATGRVWRYEPLSSIGGKGDPDEISVDPYFSEVTVDSLHGSHDAEIERAITFYNSAHNARVRAYCSDHPLGTYTSPSASQGTNPGIDCQSFLKTHPDQ